MRLVTAPYKAKTFFFPMTDNKSEGFWAVPLTRTMLHEVRQNAIVEAGADYDVADSILDRMILERCLRGWKRFESQDGKPFDFCKEAIKELWEFNPELAHIMAQSIRQLFRIGELDEKKN